LEYVITITGLDLDGNQTADTDDDVVGAHIHQAEAGVNGLIVFGIIDGGDDDGDDLTIDPVAGTISGVWDNPPDTPTLSDVLDALNDSELYINIHTRAIPTGEIRGQIEPAP
jgi:hypothetical protein